MSLHLRDIPEAFHSSETGAPIQHCKVCNKYLLDGAEYIIEKALVHYPGMNTTDLVWEFAICTDCTVTVMSEYSEESNRKMQEYFSRNMNLSHLRELTRAENFEAHDWLNKCIITGKEMSECSQYQITGQCMGNLMLFENGPFMISGEAMDEIVQLLSNETLGAMNDFRDRHFPPPEDLSPLLRDKDFVFI